MYRVVRTLLLGGLFGKALAILRELISAWLLGTGTVASAYRLAQAAFLIPLHGFVSDALSVGFTPAFSRRARDPSGSGAALFATMHAILLAVSVIVSLILMVFAGTWVRLLAPGFDAVASVMATQMVQVLAVALPAYAVTALYSSADLALGAGQISAARASMQSLGLIAGTILAWWLSQPVFIAVGFSTAYIALAVWGWWVCRRNGLQIWPSQTQLTHAMQPLKEVGRAFLTVIWLPVLAQVHLIVERRVASVVHPAAVAALDYAKFVSETAVLLIAVPFGLAGLAAMARMAAEEFKATTVQSLKVMLYVGLPASALLWANSHVVVQLLFGRGAFDATSVQVTSQILSALALGIWGQLVAYSGVKFLSAQGQNRFVLIATLIATGCAIAINLLFQKWLGVVALGVASATQGILLATLVILRLKIGRDLLGDLASLGAAALLYCLLAVLLPMPWRSQLYLWIPMSAVFWLIALAGIRRHRIAVRQIFALLHKGG